MPKSRNTVRCFRCGQALLPDEPRRYKRQRLPAIGWRIQHVECSIAYRGTAKARVPRPAGLEDARRLHAEQKARQALRYADRLRRRREKRAALREQQRGETP